MNTSARNSAAVRTLMLLSLTNCLSYVHRVLPAAAAPLLKAEFKLTDAELGLVTGFAFSLFYAIVGLPLARLADQRSRRLLISVSVAIWSALTMLCGMAFSTLQFILCRFGVGAAESGATSAAYSIITDSFAPKRRPFAFSLLLSGTMVGLMIGLALGGWVAARFGWRVSFLALGAPGLLLALAVRLFVFEPPRGSSDLAADAPRPLDAPVMTGFLPLLRNRPFAWMALSNAVGTFNIFVVTIWLPLFYQRTHHLPLAIVSLVFGIAFGGGLLVGTLIGGALGAVTARRDPLDLRLPIFSYMALPPIYWLLLWLPNPWVSLTLVLLAAVVYGLGNPTFAAASQSVAAPDERAKALAVLVLGNSIIGYGLGSYAIGLLSDFLTPALGAAALRSALSFGQVFSILGGLSLVMAAQAIRSERRRGLRLAPTPAPGISTSATSAR